MEAQLGKFTSNLNTTPLGTLPSDTKNPSPKGKEHCEVITLRSGKQIGESITDSIVTPQDTGEVILGEKVEFEELVDVPDKQVPQIVTHMPNVPSSKLLTQSKVLAQSDVNIPLVDARFQILNYGKFMKELLSKKNKLSDDLIEEEFNDQRTILTEGFAVTSDDEFLDDCDNMVKDNNIELCNWVRPVQCVPKKSGITVVSNDKDELIPTGWLVYMDYCKLNTATRKDHFPLPFIDQMLDRLAGKAYYCFLDNYSGYNQIVIAPEDQEKKKFHLSVFVMPFGLCNASSTFQRCMLAIFSDMLEDSLEVFMDDFSVNGNDFDNYAVNLD
ncbi:uncharacterized protein [Gossypium hirsutum]|uniref:Reverse transcriptase domain-containing protein n=1 Tax=Gossypium hirsutum TaxID=3635 RepID=A0A1U8LXW9_GOSHI|nr:uncharacterized protein LOC107930703 [Gossypium hirsutum]